MGHNLGYLKEKTTIASIVCLVILDFIGVPMWEQNSGTIYLPLALQGQEPLATEMTATDLHKQAAARHRHHDFPPQK